MNTMRYALKFGTFEVRRNDVDSMNDIITIYFAKDTDDKIIREFDNQQDATAALAVCRSDAHEFSSNGGRYISGTLHFVEEFEADEDGEFVSGSNYDFAPFDKDILAE